MAKFRVDPATLADAVTEMEKFHKSVQTFNGQTEQLMTRLAKTWDSEAASAGQRAYEELQSGAEQLGESLRQLRAFLDGAGKGYAQATMSNKLMWGG